jgi:hypothetical protein
MNMILFFRIYHYIPRYDEDKIAWFAEYKQLCINIKCYLVSGEMRGSLLTVNLIGLGRGTNALFQGVNSGVRNLKRTQMCRHKFRLATFSVIHAGTSLLGQPAQQYYSFFFFQIHLSLGLATYILTFLLDFLYI